MANKKQALAEADPSGSAERGGKLWAFRRMKEDALTALLDDLLEAHDGGIIEEHCNHVRIALGKMVNTATSIGDGSIFSPPVWTVMDQFEKNYISWNEPKGQDEVCIQHRRKQFVKLRRIRAKLAKRVRVHSHVLQKNLDLGLIEDVYSAFGDVVKSGPQVFKNLSKAVARFAKNG